MKSDNKTNIYIGPMSKNIVDSIIEYCNDNNTYIGLIPSRRQVEYNGGYVNNWTTKEFASYVQSKTSKVKIQRDHGGRLQGNGSADFLKSYEEDALSNFDLIHIDPWKKFVDIEEMIEETAKNIEFCYSVNPECYYEVGTEEAIHGYTTNELDYFLSGLKDRLGLLWKKIKFAVIQSGTRIIGTENTGIFDAKKCKKMIDVCRYHDIMSKEHNGDYLSLQGVKTRFDLGLDGINIAPQFGVSETKIIVEELKKNKQGELLNNFFDLCYHSNKWKKWLKRDIQINKNTKDLILAVSGHYVFADPNFISIKQNIDNIDEKIIMVHKKMIQNLLNWV